jgi:hypothetical protein
MQRLLLPMLPLHVLSMLLPVLWPVLLLTARTVLLSMLLFRLKLLFQVNGQHRKANQWPRSPRRGYRFSLVSCEWPS